VKKQEWDPQQKIPESRMVHLRMLCFCEPNRRINLLVCVEHGAKNFVKGLALAIYFFNFQRNSRQNFDWVIDFFGGSTPISSIRNRNYKKHN
jgi:hypothetical protein